MFLASRSTFIFPLSLHSCLFLSSLLHSCTRVCARVRQSGCEIYTGLYYPFSWYYRHLLPHSLQDPCLSSPQLLQCSIYRTIDLNVRACEFLHVCTRTTCMLGASGGEKRLWEPTWILSVSGVTSSCEPHVVGCCGLSLGPLQE